MRILAKLSLAVILIVASFTALDLYSYYTTTEVTTAAPDVKVDTSSIVRLVDPNGNTFCSGTVINATTIATAGHCLYMSMGLFGTAPMFDKVEVRDAKNNSLGVVGFPGAFMPQLDQAILKGNFKLFKPMKIVTDPEELTKLRKEGTEFTACGFPMGRELFCTALVFVQPVAFFWAAYGVLIPGMSGGPVIYNGQVVAINSAVEGAYAIVAPTYNLPIK